ncbi:hypothetical protein GV64_20770 [Endozoicomonas elysicola]|uniref:Pilus assembly protein PilE n=2 Tax=Endozoicomonas elysicola TaxID=305900 RepID=A0A081KFA5_9GAMM|nr:hypothetical protein GV64_20770 [Endozoicomonas elysicola]
MINKGFSLIELMIALVIVGILVSIVFPSYRQYVVESRRSDGIAMLMWVMQQQERFYTEQLSYTTDLTQLGFTANPASENNNYTINAAQCGTDPLNRCVLLTAVPQGDQTGDGNLTLNSRGVRTPVDFW